MRAIDLENAAVRYAAAAGVVAFATALQHAVWPYIPPSPHFLFYPAVFLAAWLGGAGPGYLATACSAVGIAYVFLEPRGLAVGGAARDGLDLVIFVGVSCGISAVMGRLRRGIREERARATEAALAKQATDDTWSMVAHDLRTPLSVIRLSSQALAGDDEHALAVERIRRSTDRAGDLVQDALDAMRLAGGALHVEASSFRLRELAEKVVDGVAPIAEKKGVALDLDVAPTVVVEGDERRLHQVLANLVGNAVKFTPRGGRVAIRATAGGGRVSVEVVDTGQGISPDEIDAIFTKYWTARTGSGVGLGLWIARAIVEAHGARLNVESRPGHGATFTFALRAAA